MKPVAVLACLGLALLLTGGASPTPPEIRPVRTIVVTPQRGGGTGVAHRPYPGAHGGKPRLPHRRQDDRAPGQCGAGRQARRPGRRTRPAAAAGRLAGRAGRACRGAGRPPRSHQQPGAPADAGGPGLVHPGPVRCRGEGVSSRQGRRSMPTRPSCTRPKTSSATRQLVADAAGAVIATGAEAGEVVRAGQMIVTVAHHDGADAVFDVPASLMRQVSPDAVDQHRTDRRSDRPHDRAGAGSGAAGGSGDAKLPGQGRLDRMAASHAAGRDGDRAGAHGGSGRHRASGNRADHGGQQAGRLGGRSTTQQVSLRPVELQRQDSSSIVVDATGSRAASWW